MLGSYLMYAFGALAAWRILLEFWTTVRRSQVAYFTFALIALSPLLYQVKQAENSSTIMRRERAISISHHPRPQTRESDLIGNHNLAAPLLDVWLYRVACVVFGAYKT